MITQGTGIESLADSGHFIRGLASLDPRVRDVLAKTVPLPQFTGKGADWDDFVLSWQRWWPLSGLPELCKAEVFKETLPTEMRNQVDKLISRDNWTYETIFSHFTRTFSGHSNRFSQRDKWEQCRCPEKPSVLTFTTWFTTWSMLGRQVEGLTGQQIVDQYLRSVPAYWVKKLVHEIRKRDQKRVPNDKGEIPRKWGTLEDLRCYMEDQLRDEEFVNIVKEQITGHTPKKTPTNPVNMVRHNPRDTSGKEDTLAACPVCHKTNHTESQCYFKHPEKRPEWSKVKANRARSAPPRASGRLTPEEMKVLKKENRCFWCKKEGHVARECPDKKRGSTPGRNNPVSEIKGKTTDSVPAKTNMPESTENNHIK